MQDVIGMKKILLNLQVAYLYNHGQFKLLLMQLGLQRFSLQQVLDLKTYEENEEKRNSTDYLNIDF